MAHESCKSQIAVLEMNGQSVPQRWTSMREGSNTARRQCSAWNVELSAIRRAKILASRESGCRVAHTITTGILDGAFHCWTAPFAAKRIVLHFTTRSVVVVFCRAMLASSTALAVMQCPSGRVCVCLSRLHILSKRVNISSDFFHHRVDTSF